MSEKELDNKKEGVVDRNTIIEVLNLTPSQVFILSKKFKYQKPCTISMWKRILKENKIVTKFKE